jgi:hypothetical protein
MGSGLPQFGFPRRFAIELVSLRKGDLPVLPLQQVGGPVTPEETLDVILRRFCLKINSKIAHVPI